MKFQILLGLLMSSLAMADYSENVSVWTCENYKVIVNTFCGCPSGVPEEVKGNLCSSDLEISRNEKKVSYSSVARKGCGSAFRITGARQDIICLENDYGSILSLHRGKRKLKCKVKS